jgi:hypothetical protein
MLHKRSFINEGGFFKERITAALLHFSIWQQNIIHDAYAHTHKKLTEINIMHTLKNPWLTLDGI